MKHSFYKTIKGRFLLIVCSLIIVLSIGIITFTYVTFYNRLENNVIHSTDSSLSLLANDINKKLSDIYSYAQWCQNNNTDIINYIKTSPSSVIWKDYDSGKRANGRRISSESCTYLYAASDYCKF